MISAVVGIVLDIETKKVLLGKSISKDSRNGQLCFPGGGVNKNENLQLATEREVWEETGIKCLCREKFLTLHNKPHIRFYLCDYINGELKPNEEFSDISFYDVHEVLKNNDFYPENKKMLEYCLEHNLF